MVSFKSHMTLNFNKYTLLEVLAKVQEWAGNSRDQIILFSYKKKKKKGFSLKIQIMSDIDILYQYALFYLPGTVNKVEQLKSVLHL